MIYSEDIIYTDSFISILKPDINKGILICSENINSAIVDNIYYIKENSGGYTYNNLNDYGMIAYEKYIDFIVPYYVRDINYKTPKTAVLSSYGYSGLSRNKIYVRVDPDNTYILPKSTILNSEYVYTNKISLSYYMKTYYNVPIINQFFFSKSKNYKISMYIPKISAAYFTNILKN